MFARHFWSAQVTNWAVYSGATGVVLLAILVAFSVAWEGDSEMAGLVQRALIIAGWAWIALLAAHLVGKVSQGRRGNHPGPATRR